MIRFPPFFAPDPDKVHGKVLVEIVVCLWKLLIGFEVGSQCGIFLSSLSSYLLKIWSNMLIPGDQLLIWKMDLQSNNTWALLVHVKMMDSPESFTGRHIASIKILFGLILTYSKLHSCVIMAFVHIFVNVLDGFD